MLLFTFGYQKINRIRESRYVTEVWKTRLYAIVIEAWYQLFCLWYFLKCSSFLIKDRQNTLDHARSVTYGTRSHSILRTSGNIGINTLRHKYAVAMLKNQESHLLLNTQKKFDLWENKPACDEVHLFSVAMCLTWSVCCPHRPLDVIVFCLV
jgi:hypothetical protein